MSSDVLAIAFSAEVERIAHRTDQHGLAPVGGFLGERHCLAADHVLASYVALSWVIDATKVVHQFSWQTDRVVHAGIHKRHSADDVRSRSSGWRTGCTAFTDGSNIVVNVERADAACPRLTSLLPPG